MESYSVKKYNKYDVIWMSKKYKTDFERFMAMLAEYCGYGQSSSLGRKHTKIITEIYDAYFGKNEFYRKNPDSLACTVEFVYFLIKSKINLKDIEKQGDMNALINVIKQRTKFDTYTNKNQGDFFLGIILFKDINLKSALSIFRDYCRINLVFPFKAKEDYSQQIQTVLNKYDGYLQNYPDSLACTVEYLLYTIRKATNKPVSDSSYLHSLLFRLEYESDLLRGAKNYSYEFISKCDSDNIVNFSKWSTYIERNFPVAITSLNREGYIANCIGFNELVQYYIDNIDLLDKTFNRKNLCQLISEKDKDSAFITGYKNLFKAALDKKQYDIALALNTKIMGGFNFIDSKKIENKTGFEQFEHCFMNEYKSFTNYSNVELMKLEHLKTHYLNEMMDENNECEYKKPVISFYRKLFKNRKQFDNWDVIDSKYLEYFKPDINYLLYYDIDFARDYFSSHIGMSNDILAMKRIDLFKTNYYCVEKNDRFTASFDCFDKAAYTITPLQCIVIKYLTEVYGSRHNTKPFFPYLDLILAQDDKAIFRPDGKGRDILYYLEKIKDYKNYIDEFVKINEYIDKLYARKHRNNLFIFFCSKYDPNSLPAQAKLQKDHIPGLPNEVYGAITHQADLKEDVSINEVVKLTK